MRCAGQRPHRSEASSWWRMVKRAPAGHGLDGFPRRTLFTFPAWRNTWASACVRCLPGGRAWVWTELAPPCRSKPEAPGPRRPPTPRAGGLNLGHVVASSPVGEVGQAQRWRSWLGQVAGGDRPRGRGDRCRPTSGQRRPTDCRDPPPRRPPAAPPPRGSQTPPLTQPAVRSPRQSAALPTGSGPRVQGGAPSGVPPPGDPRSGPWLLSRVRPHRVSEARSPGPGRGHRRRG